MSASDGDDDEITYSIASADDHFAINASTGQIDLVKSLDRENVEEIRLVVWATDNGRFRVFVYSLLFNFKVVSMFLQSVMRL